MIRIFSICCLIALTVRAVPTEKLGMALPEDGLTINDDSRLSDHIDVPILDQSNSWEEEDSDDVDIIEVTGDEDEFWTMCGIDLPDELDQDSAGESDSQPCKRASAGGGGGRGGGGGGGGGRSSSSSSSSSSSGSSEKGSSGSSSSGSNAGAGAAGAGAGAGAGAAGAANRNNGNNNGKKNKTSDALPSKLIGIEGIGFKGPIVLVSMLFFGSLISLI